MDSLLRRQVHSPWLCCARSASSTYFSVRLRCPPVARLVRPAPSPPR